MTERKRVEKMQQTGFTPVARPASDTSFKPVVSSKQKTWEALSALSPTLGKLAEIHGGVSKQKNLSEMEEAYSKLTIGEKKALAERTASGAEKKDPTFAADNPWRHIYVEEKAGEYLAQTALYDRLEDEDVKEYISNPANSIGDINAYIEQQALEIRPFGVYSGPAFDKFSAQILQHTQAKSLSLREASIKEQTSEAFKSVTTTNIAHQLRGENDPSDFDISVIEQENENLWRVSRENGREPTIEMLSALIKGEVALAKTPEEIENIKKRGLAIYEKLMTVKDGQGRKTWGEYYTETEKELWEKNITELVDQSMVNQEELLNKQKQLVDARVSATSARFFNRVEDIGFDEAFEEWKEEWSSARRDLGVTDDLVDEKENWEDEKYFMQKMYNDIKTEQSRMDGTDYYAQALEIALSSDQVVRMSNQELGVKFGGRLSKQELDTIWNLNSQGVGGMIRQELTLSQFKTKALTQLQRMSPNKFFTVEEENKLEEIYNSYMLDLAVRVSQDKDLLEDPRGILNFVKQALAEEANDLIDPYTESLVTYGEDYNEHNAWHDLTRDVSVNSAIETWATSWAGKVKLVGYDENGKAIVKDWTYEALYIARDVMNKNLNLPPNERAAKVIDELNSINNEAMLYEKYPAWRKPSVPELDREGNQIYEDGDLAMTKMWIGLGDSSNPNVAAFPDFTEEDKLKYQSENPAYTSSLSSWPELGTPEFDLLSTEDQYMAELHHADKRSRERASKQLDDMAFGVARDAFFPLESGLIPTTDMERALAGQAQKNLDDRKRDVNELGVLMQPSQRMIHLGQLREISEMEQVEDYQDLPRYKQNISWVNQRKAAFNEGRKSYGALSRLPSVIKSDNFSEVAIIARRSGISHDSFGVSGLSISEIKSGEIIYLGQRVKVSSDLMNPTNFLMETATGDYQDVFDALPMEIRRRIERDAKEDGISPLEELKEKQNALRTILFIDN